MKKWGNWEMGATSPRTGNVGGVSPVQWGIVHKGQCCGVRPHWDREAQRRKGIGLCQRVQRKCVSGIVTTEEY